MDAQAKTYLFPTSALDAIKKNITGFPSDNIPPEDKLKKDYALASCRAVLQYYVTNQCGILYADQARFNLNRMYGDGEQPVQIYQEMLGLNTEDINGNGDTGNNGNNVARKGWLNVNWKVISQIPKLMKIVIGMSDAVDYIPTPLAIDEVSGVEREELKWKTWLETQLGPVKQAMAEMQGMPYEEPLFVPKSIQELEMYEETGGIKLPIEAAVEKILTSAFYESDWDKEVAQKIIADLFNLNVGAAKDYVDPFTQKCKARYVDPAKLIIQYSKTHEYKDSQFAAELVEYTIKQVVAENPDITEEQILAVAGMYDGWMTNTKGDYDYTNAPFSTERYGLDAQNVLSYKITVADVEWIGVNKKRANKKKDKSGTDRYFPDEKGNTETSYMTVYKAKWIPGTDIIWDYGQAYDIPYDRMEKRPLLSYHVSRVQGKSFTETLIPMADMYCINWFKFQNAWAMAPPAGLAVEYTSLINMKLGEKTLSPKDILALRMQTGTFPYKNTNIFGKMQSGGFPFQELQGGLGRQADEFFRAFDFFAKLEQELAGFTSIAAANTPSKDALVGVQQLAYEATANVLRPLMKSFVNIKEKVSRNIARRGQVIAKYNPKGYTAYQGTIGGGSLEVLKISADRPLADIGIMIRVVPQSAKQFLQELLAQAMRPGKDGDMGITYGDALFIRRMIDAGQLIQAEMWLSYKQKKAQDQKEKFAQQNAQVNGEQARETEAMKFEKQKEMITHEANEQIRTEYWKSLFTQDATLQQKEIESYQSYLDTILASVSNNQDRQLAQPPQEAMEVIAQ